MTDRSATLRAFYARFVSRCGGARYSCIEQAFAAVPREPFAGPGPWLILAPDPLSPRPADPAAYVRTPDDDPTFLYQNTLVALDPARGINIGEPSLHARCLDELAPHKGNTVLHVGAGSGYYTALLAHLVGPAGRIHAYEIDSELAARAARNLAHLSHVEVHARSGIGQDLPQADRVYVNAGITQPSRTWLDALRPGGRLIFPLQPPRRLGGMLLVQRPTTGDIWPARFVTRAAFISCDGRQDNEMGKRLANAFAKRDTEAVRSLRLRGEPDATCWCAGDDWWLSTREPETIR
jgi:protein-L-isoaspartate(D-aspartate) O-methyltransferase